jgi:hypothetical protein
MIGFLPFALTDETVTSLSALIFVVSFTFSCEKEKIENRAMKIEDTIFFFALGTWYLALGFNKIFIRKKLLQIKRGNYSLVKNKNVCFL